MRSALGTEKAGLYPLQALVRPVALRFKYHFEGTRPTNRLDKVCTCPSLALKSHTDCCPARMVPHTCSKRCARASGLHGHRHTNPPQRVRASGHRRFGKTCLRPCRPAYSPAIARIHLLSSAASAAEAEAHYTLTATAAFTTGTHHLSNPQLRCHTCRAGILPPRDVGGVHCRRPKPVGGRERDGARHQGVVRRLDGRREALYVSRDFHL